MHYATFTNVNDGAVAYSGGVVLPGIHSYTNTFGTLTFTNGVTNQTFTVPLIDNGLQDGNRTFSVRLFGQTGGAQLGLSNATVRIVDNESAAGTVDTGYITGVGANGTVFSIQVATNGQAVLGGDFTAVSGVARQNVARINVDGALDNGFDPGTITFGTNAGTVRALGLYTNGVNANKKNTNHLRGMQELLRYCPQNPAAAGVHRPEPTPIPYSLPAEGPMAAALPMAPQSRQHRHDPARWHDASFDPVCQQSRAL